METINNLIMTMAFGPIPEHKNDNELLARYSARLAEAVEPLKKILRRLAGDPKTATDETRRLAREALEILGEPIEQETKEKQNEDIMLGPNPNSPNKIYVGYAHMDNGMVRSYAWARNKDPYAVFAKLQIIGDHTSSDLGFARHDIRFTGHDRQYAERYPDGYCFIDLGSFPDAASLNDRLQRLARDIP